MAAKVLGLVLASSLLWATPLCRCEGAAPAKQQKASCGHCPSKPTHDQNGFPKTDCCCINEGTDRTSEPAFGILPTSVTVDLDLSPTVSGFGPITDEPEIASMADIAIHRLAGC